MTSVFERRLSIETRQKECERLLAKYPDTIPVVLHNNKEKAAYQALPPTAITADLIAAVRQLESAPKNRAISIAVGGCAPSITTPLKELYEACKNCDDSFLYVQYTAEKRLGVEIGCQGPDMGSVLHGLAMLNMADVQ